MASFFRRYLTLKNIIKVFAVALSAFHIHAAIFGPPEEMIFRAVHLGFVMLLLFFVSAADSSGKKRIWRIIDICFGLTAAASIVYLLYDYNDIVSRFAYIDPVKNFEKIFGGLLLVLVLEGTRRRTGPTLPLIAVLSMLYAIFGEYFPEGLRHQGLSFGRLVEQMYLLPDGLFGVPLGVSAKYIVIFLLFGAFLEQAGAATFFTDFASSLVGKAKGGPAKVAVVASSLFGTISGAPVANVVVTGTFTIPAMIKIGIRPEVAGAIEATASTGGALMPPILGATCFIIVEYTGHPYSEVITWALLPALLYYICIYSTIYLETIKYDIGASDEAFQPFKQVLFQQGFIFIPLLVLMYLILKGHSPSFAAWVSILFIILVSWLRRRTRIGPKKFIVALEKGGEHVVSIAVACACAGIITGVILLTGVGMTITSLFLRLSGGSLFMMLVLSVVPLLVLGMGMPAAPAYVICASLFAPAMIKAGLSVPATHFFIYYYALLSAISPPVALAAFAASSVSGASPIRTAFWAVRVAVIAYILPFTFAYSPELLMIGSPLAILVAFITAAIGTFSLVCAMEGILLVRLHLFFRLVLAVTGILMIVPGFMTDLVGVTTISGILICQKFLKARELLKAAN